MKTITLNFILILLISLLQACKDTIALNIFSEEKSLSLKTTSGAANVATSSSYNLKGECRENLTIEELSRPVACRKFAFNENLDLTSLPDGEHVITLKDSKTSVTHNFIKDVQLPVVNLDSLNDGGFILAGDTTPIVWSASDSGSGLAALPVTLEYSVDNGAIWLPISNFVPNSSIYTWVPPSTNETQVLIRVTVTDAAGNSSSAISIVPFELAVSPITRVEVPSTNSTKFSTIAISPRNSSLIAVEDSLGMIYQSNDSGLTWNKLCRNPYSVGLRGRLQFSKGSDNSLYSIGWGTLMPVTDRDGENCHMMTHPGNGINYSNKKTPYFATDSLGHVYVHDHGSGVYKSTNMAHSATLLVANNNNYYTSVYINPFDETKVLLANSSSIKLFNQSNSSLSVVHTGIPDTEYLSFDPVNQGRVYSSAGIFSADGGVTWQTDANYNAANMRSFHLNAQGNAFRLNSDGTNLLIQKSQNLITPNWTTLAASGLVALDDNIANSQVVSEGSNILVLDRNDKYGNLFISRDGGTTFSAITLNEPTPSSLASIGSSDGVTIYGTNRKGEIYKSTDAGLNWALVQTPMTEVFNVYNNYSIYAFPHPNNPNSILFKTHGTATYGEDFASSTDGFATARFSNPLITNTPYWGYATAIAQNPFNGNELSVLGSGFSEHQKTSDYGVTWSNMGSGMVGCCDSYHHIAVPDTVNPTNAWYMAAGNINYYDGINQTTTALGNIPFSPAEWEFYGGANSEVIVRMLSNDGTIATTSDNFQTYTMQANTEGFTSCIGFSSLAANRNHMASFCQLNGIYYAVYTTDGGASWLKLDLTKSKLVTEDQYSPGSYYLNVWPAQLTLTANNLFVSDGSTITYKMDLGDFE